MTVPFADRVIAWQRCHGRRDLPWQNTRDPYPIWVSEIMLQQTQVAAVIPYYQRFMARFPDLAALAGADEDDVLAHWSGLGYYSRARNLHAAAKVIVESHGGKFPAEVSSVMALPGIGRSTAAAIGVFSSGDKLAILDGNVKRVLARCMGVDGWPGLPAVEKRLWCMAELLLPEAGIEAYTQGMMDLGATVCTRSRPRCHVCPVAENCVARMEERTGELPAAKPRKMLPERETVMLLLWRAGEVLLEKRPAKGVWGGMWSLPEAPPGGDFAHWAESRYGIEAVPMPPLPGLTHTFTHFRLHIRLQPMQVRHAGNPTAAQPTLWMLPEDALGAALPAPVKTLLAGF